MINRYTLKLLGLPVPIFAFQPRKADEDHALSVPGLYLLGVKTPSNKTTPKGAYAIDLPSLVPILGDKADKDLDENKSYYGRVEGISNPLDKFDNLLKVNEGNIPYLHGELIKFGKIPFSSLQVTDSSLYLADKDTQESCFKMAKFQSLLSNSKIPYNGGNNKTGSFKNFYERLYRTEYQYDESQSFIYRKIGNTVVKLHEWFEVNTDQRVSGLMDTKRLYSDNSNNIYAFESSFTDVTSLSEVSTNTITYNGLTYQKKPYDQAVPCIDRLLCENSTGQEVYAYMSLSNKDERFSITYLYFPNIIEKTDVVNSYINLQCYRPLTVYDCDTPILNKSFINLNTRDNRITSFGTKGQKVEWFIDNSDSIQTLWFLSVIFYQNIENTTESFDFSEIDTYYNKKGEAAICKPNWTNSQSTGFNFYVKNNITYACLKNGSGETICPGVAVEGPINHLNLPSIENPQEQQGG